jgi:superfamily II DNA helicase RecQ
MQYSRQQVYEALARHFGFSEFLNAQESIVTGLLEGKSLLAIMPTGSGKSLCFQLPAMIMEGYGLVVSPMISLMKDQVMPGAQGTHRRQTQAALYGTRDIGSATDPGVA